MKNDKELATSSEKMETISCAEYETMQTQIQWLMKQLRLFRQKLLNETEVYANQTAKGDDGSVVVAAHKRYRKHEYTLDELSENDCGEDLQKSELYPRQFCHTRGCA